MWAMSMMQQFHGSRTQALGNLIMKCLSDTGTSASLSVSQTPRKMVSETTPKCLSDTGPKCLWDTEKNARRLKRTS